MGAVVDGRHARLVISAVMKRLARAVMGASSAGNPTVQGALPSVRSSTLGDEGG
jgi:hypothetical protein